MGDALLLMFGMFTLGGIIGAAVYLFDDDDGIVVFYGNVFHSKAVWPLLLVIGLSIAWAFYLVSGAIVLGGLFFVLGWLVSAYIMGIIWPTWDSIIKKLEDFLAP